MQTIKITITSPNPANIHIKECKPKDDVKEKLFSIFKQAISKETMIEERGSKLASQK